MNGENAAPQDTYYCVSQLWRLIAPVTDFAKRLVALMSSSNCYPVFLFAQFTAVTATSDNNRRSKELNAVVAFGLNKLSMLCVSTIAYFYNNTFVSTRTGIRRSIKFPYYYAFNYLRRRGVSVTWCGILVLGLLVG
ncbi:hypothetical protein PT974_07045 [Cladobotryum mycophilum]|uniref:Uncharacterized protein n=1 Tax=Cladobotryum mycophilum TaxID=491253 RepID=A0ABR0SN51_9HYPO